MIGTIDPAGPMTSYAYVVTATGNAANDQITFREVGQGHLPLPGQADEGYHGTYLANVAVIATAVVDEDGLTARRCRSAITIAKSGTTSFPTAMATPMKPPRPATSTSNGVPTIWIRP